MTKPKWKKGPPPSVGWWPASFTGNPDVCRWWDGKRWSQAAPSILRAKDAARQATIPTAWPADVLWTDRPESWPARSRT